ncbi:dienelactone hydrolase family protein [Amphritea sp. HPY]|uniref:dienelactone hydrolase family protein n=1 Tax=Amphritea sp. HPY TaxID=3421652 RepID=UPI003D7C736E
MTVLKKIIILIVAVVMLMLGGGVYYVQTQYAGIGLPWVSSIELPAFPELPEPQTTLSAGQSGDIYFATRSPYDFSELLHNFDNTLQNTGKGHLTLPKGASADQPVPAMIILHGSGGIDKDREPVYARMFAEQGIAAFVLDYYSVRGVTPDISYLMKTLSASETDIIVDAYSALKVLGSHPAIDASRIGVTGYSYGGMATRYTLDSRLKQIIAPDVPAFAAHIDVYGPCHQTLGFNGTTGAPYLAIYGDQDNSVNVAQCQPVHKAIEQSGSPLEQFMISGAGHAWESRRPRDEYDYPYISGCDFTFDADRGAFHVNGKATPPAPAGADRDERAYARAAIGIYAPECIQRGYIIGKDKSADSQAKQKMQQFLQRYLLDVD